MTTAPKQPQGIDSPNTNSLRQSPPRTNSTSQMPQDPTTTPKYPWTSAEPKEIGGRDRAASRTMQPPPPLLPKRTAITVTSPATSPVTAPRKGRKLGQLPPRAGKQTTARPPPWYRRNTRKITPPESMQRSPPSRPSPRMKGGVALASTIGGRGRQKQHRIFPTPNQFGLDQGT